MTDNPVARTMIGYLLVRGGTHILAYAKAIEIATGRLDENASSSKS